MQANPTSYQCLRMLTLLVVLIHNTFVICLVCDRWRDYHCTVALMKGHYEKCSKVIQESQDEWFVCEVRDCDDMRQINKYKQLSNEVNEK